MASKKGKRQPDRSPIEPSKSGLSPEHEAAPEDRAAYEQLIAQYYERFHPRYPEERALLDDVIFCDWSIRRFQRLQTDGRLGAADWESILASKHAAYRSALKFLRDYQAQPIPGRPVQVAPMKVVVH
jgi:hypothetical protein